MTEFLLDSADLGEAEAVLGATYSKLRLRPGSPEAPASIRIERSLVGSVHLDAAEIGCDIAYEMESPRHIVLCRVLSGGIEEHAPRRDVTRYAPGDVVAFASREEHGHRGCALVGRYEQLVVDRGVLNRVNDGVPRASDPIGLIGSAPVPQAATLLVANAIDYLRRTSELMPDPRDSPLLVASIENHVAALILATVPGSALNDAPAGDRRDTTPVLLRRTIAFIDENAHRDITVVDIAEHVLITPRALQLLFRKHRQCTPMEYVRRVRLSHAHRELVAGSRQTTTVAGVARRWGFAHLGRFSVYYRDHYDQSPHITLRNPG